MGETPRKRKTAQKAQPNPASPKKAPIGLLAAAWFVPGLGHWILGRKKRAVVFAVVIVCEPAPNVSSARPSRKKTAAWLSRTMT